MVSILCPNSRHFRSNEGKINHAFITCDDDRRMRTFLFSKGILEDTNAKLEIEVDLINVGEWSSN